MKSKSFSQKSCLPVTDEIASLIEFASLPEDWRGQGQRTGDFQLWEEMQGWIILCSFMAASESGNLPSWFCGGVFKCPCGIISDCSQPSNPLCTMAHFFLFEFQKLSQINIKKISHAPSQLCRAWPTLRTGSWAASLFFRMDQPIGIQCPGSYLITKLLNWGLGFSVCFVFEHLYPLVFVHHHHHANGLEIKVQRKPSSW